MNSLNSIRQAVEKTASHRASHIESIGVAVEAQGRPSWHGTVEVFAIGDEKLAFGWVDTTKNDNADCVAVVGNGRIRTAADAVRVWLDER